MFSDGSKELRSLGRFLRNQQGANFQPFFAIQEHNHEEIRIDISPAMIQSMITKSTFDLGPVDISNTSQIGELSIILCLLREGTTQLVTNPIGGSQELWRPRTLHNAAVI